MCPSPTDLFYSDCSKARVSSASFFLILPPPQKRTAPPCLSRCPLRCLAKDRSFHPCRRFFSSLSFPPCFRSGLFFQASITNGVPLGPFVQSPPFCGLFRAFEKEPVFEEQPAVPPSGRRFCRTFPFRRADALPPLPQLDL